ncbi:MAG: CapA family protein, partial [Gemmatimonadetes bacterium]|nr:CapA family protein [Gemmatimonadota bacterium]
PFAGTGRTREAARRPVILAKHGWRIALFAVTRAYNPAPNAFYRHVGSRHIAYADTAWLYPAIRRIRADSAADLVVLSIHAGDEYTPLPDQRLVDFVRGAVDAGADIVLGHHPHVLRPVEWYRGKPIAYSLGNFIFQQRPPWTNLSAIFQFTVEPDGTITVGLVPIRVGFQATLADSAAGDSVRTRMQLSPTAPTVSSTQTR